MKQIESIERTYEMGKGEFEVDFDVLYEKAKKSYDLEFL